MSAKRIQQNLIRGFQPPTGDWTKPTDWLDVGLPDAGSQEIRMLVAVWNGASTVTFRCTGAITVDWGDGSAPVNVASAVNATKTLDWSGCDPGTTTDVGFRQAVVVVTPQAGQNITTFDYRNPAPVIDLAVSLPQNSGDLFFAYGQDGGLPIVERIRVRGSHNGRLYLGYSNTQSMPRLQTMACPENGSYDYHIGAQVGTAGSASLGMFQGCSALRKAPRLSSTSSLVSTQSMFSGCLSMVEVPTFDMSNSTSAYSMFYNCQALAVAPSLNTTKVTDSRSMFYQCYSLNQAGPFDFAVLTDAGQMFYNCRTLVDVTLTTPALLDATSMFYSCYSLKTAPAMDLSKIVTAASMFYSCVSLITVPSYTTSALLNASNMFYGCMSLRTIPLFDTSKVTNAQAMFRVCGSLQSVPLFDLSKVTDASYMFYLCASLQAVPAFDLALATNVAAMFNATAIQSLTMAFPSATNFTGFIAQNISLRILNITCPVGVTMGIGGAGNGMVEGCTGLVSLTMTAPNATSFLRLGSSTGSIETLIVTGARYAIDVVNNKLQGAALDAFYTSLGTAAGAQTITVTGNPGTSGDTPSIATSKGWTVTGS